ncbi:MAG: 4Fe-4S binding protein [Methanothrix sp.]|jgi:pyruvate ferredoxin oxidoreductase delta subunit|nr:4Fe-4S binding protein [Methanothrix sp.]
MDIKAGRLVDPCSTRLTKTGAWRTFVPVFDHDKCIKCSLCEIYCPEGCIHQVDGLFVPDLDYCKGCSVCAHECPRMAISMVLEEK